MISFENYSVEEIQAALAALALEVGFQPLNVVPILRAKHLDGLKIEKALISTQLCTKLLRSSWL